MVLPRRRRGPIRLVRHEVSLVPTEIATGRFQRGMALMAAFSAIVSGFEAYMQHQRGAFKDRWMWTPVWLTGPMVAAAGAAVVSERAARRVLPVVSAAALVDGLLGFGFHLRGIARMPGGFRLGQYNVVMGPPVFAPLLMCIVGVLGGLASLLRPERLRLPPPAVRRVADALEEQRSHTSRGLAPRVADDIRHGRFQQGMAVTAASFAVLAGGEAYFEHLRGSFNRRVMWTPVWVTPPMVAAGIGAARSERVARTALPVVSVVTFLDGMLGFALHLRGVKRMPGRFTNLRFNLTMGPPLFAPLLFCSVGLLGLIAALLRPEEGTT